MKVNACAVFVLIAMAVCLDCVSSDEEGSSPATSTCGSVVPEQVYNKLESCFITEAHNVKNMYLLEALIFKMHRLYKDAKSMNHYRLAEKYQCNNVPNLKQCLAGVVAASEGCLEAVEKTRLLLNVTFIQTTMEVTCLDGGVIAATIEEKHHKALQNDSSGLFDFFYKCKREAEGMIALTHEPNQDPNDAMKRQYHTLIDGMECLLLLRGQGHDTVIDAGRTHWSNILERMKCVDTRTGSLVLCKTIIKEKLSTSSLCKNCPPCSPIL